jgi:para-nitrobenzyl esterase
MRFERSRRVFLRRGASLAVSSSALLLPAWAQPSVEAETAFGRVRGTQVRGINVFKGVPYGASTGGNRRFMPPVDPAKWTGVRDALAFGSISPQRQPAPRREADEQGAGQGARESEDCLVLNVWTPGIDDGAKRPVLLWCHGGGFNTGSGSAPVNDGTNLGLRGDVVTVTVNHRLNVLGYTYLGEIAGPGFEQSGAVGVLDIVHALKWVRDNVQQFGGDPGNVTIIGQSGGARKVSTLLTIPAAKGLFHRAVVMSGSTLELTDREQGARVTRELVAQLGLSKPSIADLQALPIDRLMTAYFATVARLSAQKLGRGFEPTVDGTAITQHPFHPAASGVSADVPVIFSHTSGEATFRAEELLYSLDEAGMRARIEERVGAKADGLIALYRKLYPGSTPSDLYFRIASDHQYGGAAMKAAERRAALGRGAAYLYYWTWESPLEGGKYRAQHTIDIPFFFDTVEASRLTKGVPDAQALADQVSEMFLAFARTGDPNTPQSKLPHWPKFEPRNRATMVFDATPSLENDPIREQRLAIWDAMGLPS